MGYKLDFNTYIKVIISFYFDYEMAVDRKENMLRLYIHFANDTTDEQLDFCTNLLNKYISIYISDPTKSINSQDIYNKKGNKKTKGKNSKLDADDSDNNYFGGGYEGTKYAFMQSDLAEVNEMY